MAQRSSIFKIDINLSNFNTHYYRDFNLTIAKHPSENESRMMYRLLAFLYFSHEDLKFTKGLSNVDEPELWQIGYSGDIIEWIEMGLPDLKRVRQACSKSESVKIVTYHETKSHDWFQKNKSDFEKIDKLQIFHFNIIENGPIDKFVTKSMKLSCLIENQLMYLSDDNERVGIQVQRQR